MRSARELQARMDVAVDDLEPGLGGAVWRGPGVRTVENIGHDASPQAVACRRGNVSSGLSAHMRATRLAGKPGGIGSIAVELPVRIVARKQQHAIRADLVDQLLDAGLVGRGIERLRREPHVIAHDVGRRAIDPRHLHAHALPGLVGPPHEGRQPADARFHQHDLEARKLAEHALEDEAQQLRLVRLRLGDVVLEPIGRPADRARRHAVLAAGMDRERQLVALGRRVDRPEMAAAEQRLALRQHQDRHEAGIARQPLDLLDGEVRRLHRHDDGGPEARIARQPLRRDPVVDGAAEGGRHVGIEDRLGAVEDVADGVRRAEAVERLGLEHLEVAAGLALLGPPVGPARQRHVGRIARQVQPVDGAARDLLLPVVVEIGQQRRPGPLEPGMDIAVDPHA